MLHPVPSNRQHLNTDDCQEYKTLSELFCTVLCTTIVHCV